MQPVSQMGLGAVSHPAVTQATNRPYFLYTLAQNVSVQGPKPFTQYRQACQPGSWNSQAEQAMFYIKMSLDYYLASQTQGNIAISGHTALACKLEQIYHSFQHLVPVHPILANIMAKKTIELKTSHVLLQSEYIQNYLAQVFRGTDVFLTPSTPLHLANELGMINDICIQMNADILFEIKLSDRHIPPSPNNDYPYMQPHILIPATLTDRRVKWL